MATSFILNREFRRSHAKSVWLLCSLVLVTLQKNRNLQINFFFSRLKDFSFFLQIERFFSFFLSDWKDFFPLRLKDDRDIDDLLSWGYGEQSVKSTYHLFLNVSNIANLVMEKFISQISMMTFAAEQDEKKKSHKFLFLLIVSFFLYFLTFYILLLWSLYLMLCTSPGVSRVALHSCRLIQAMRCWIG